MKKNRDTPGQNNTQCGSDRMDVGAMHDKGGLGDLWDEETGTIGCSGHTGRWKRKAKG